MAKNTGGAARWMISSLRSDEGGGGAVGKFCIVRARLFMIQFALSEAVLGGMMYKLSTATTKSYA